MSSGIVGGLLSQALGGLDLTRNLALKDNVLELSINEQEFKQYLLSKLNNPMLNNVLDIRIEQGRIVIRIKLL
mgnify:FL=1|jgi:hypothetical protein